MPAKSRRTKPTKGDEFEAFDPNAQEEFEEFDVTAEPEAAAEATAEALGGLGATDDEFRALTQAQADIEKRYLLDPQEASAASADEGTAGLGNVTGVGIGEKMVDGKPTGQLAV